MDNMWHHFLTTARMAAAIATIAFSQATQADFEVTGPGGDRILLKDDGTWRRLGAGDKDPTNDRSEDSGEAVLSLEQSTDAPGGCRFSLKLVNNFPYEIGNIVPSFRAYRANGIVYETVSTNFNALKPGNSLKREIQFQGIPCRDVVRLQVTGGDRCAMGDLDRFSLEEGRCLARVKLEASSLVSFDK